MLYPVLPIYLKTIGFSVVLIGILEGFAEATAGISKGYFGKLSDHTGKRVLFVQMGYAFSALSKPMMAFFVYPLWIFFARAIDRFGKGIRTGARDAILSDEATIETKGKIFGFHRSMDTVGAVLGPACALLYLYYNPQDYKTLFYLAFIPGLFALVATLYLKDKSQQSSNQKKWSSISFFSFLTYWKESPLTYRRIVIGLLGFSLLNSSDVFLLLKVKESGFDDSVVIGIYIFYNLVYALSAFFIGMLGDKIGFKKIFIIGLLIFAMVYIGMTFSSHLYSFIVLFFLYGIYASSTEGISKAWISKISNKNDTATAIGTFSGFQTITLLVASSFTGLIWFQFGSKVAFAFSGLGVLFIVGYFIFLIEDPAHSKA